VSRSELQGDRLEGEPRREGEALDAILGSTPDGFWLVSMQGQILDVNEAACRCWVQRRELLGRGSISSRRTRRTEIAAKIEEIRRAGLPGWNADSAAKTGE
jgi:PAS domain S-box-containing protein